MRLTRRHARALAAGAATTAVYLAGAKLAGSRTVQRGAGLAVLALAGLVSAQDTAAMARKTAKRVTDHVGSHAPNLANGGTITGNLNINGTLSMLDHDINRVGNLNPATGQANVHSTGGLTLGGNIDLAGNSISNCDHISNGAAFVNFPSGVTATKIGPGSDRAALGSQPFTSAGLNAVQARCDYLLAQLQGANICY